MLSLAFIAKIVKNKVIIMKKFIKYFLLSFAALGIFGVSVSIESRAASITYADKTTPTPRTGSSGTLMFVNGNGNFKKGEANLAIYCFNSESDNAWSDSVDYRVSGDTIRIMIPYKNGVAKTWSKYIVCRYNPSMNPTVNGWSGVYNQSDDIYFSSFINNQNTITVTGINNDKVTIAELKSYIDYYGILADNHMYLDLSGFTSWEDGYAKFAIYFANPGSTNESRWGESYYNETYYTSFCWKVNGQDNDHLYECVIPNIYSGGKCIWNTVIAARLDPAAETPNWEQKWNQTGDLIYSSSNDNANMIRITGWNDGYLDKDNSIAKDTRLNFYGQYFLNNVSCSGHGNSDSTTSTMWDAVKYEYEHQLSKTFQGDVWTTIADEEGSLIAQAMARYDYIVLYKHYDHSDFINRQESPNKTVYASLAPVKLNDDNNTLLITMIVLLSSALLTTSLLVIKSIKRRKN